MYLVMLFSVLSTITSYLEEKEEKMVKVDSEEWVHITLSMQGKHVFMLDELRDDLSRSAYIRQLLKKERQYR